MASIKNAPNRFLEKVQHISCSQAGGAINIAPVDLNYAAIQFLGASFGYYDGSQGINAKGDFNSASQVQITIIPTAGPAAAGTYYFEVIEYKKSAIKSMQKLTAYGNTTISPVNMAKTSAIYGQRQGWGSATLIIICGHFVDSSNYYNVSRPTWLVEGK